MGCSNLSLKKKKKKKGTGLKGGKRAIFGQLLPKFGLSSIISTIFSLQIAEKVFLVIENYKVKI